MTDRIVQVNGSEYLILDRPETVVEYWIKNPGQVFVNPKNLNYQYTIERIQRSNFKGGRNDGELVVWQVPVWQDRHQKSTYADCSTSYLREENK